MRNAIREYLGLSDSEKQSLLETATIVFDANVLLNLYRYSKSTREALLDIMNSFKDRLWIPYQVAKEFMDNRPEVIIDTINKYNDMIKSADTFVEKIAADLRLKSNDESCVELNKRIIEWIETKKSINIEVTSCSDDKILFQILELFDGKVGTGFNKSKLDEIKKEGKERYSKKIPPGYMDSEKIKDYDENNAYGDLIYWKEILEYAKEKSADIILVLNDKKEDWWTKFKGQTIGPRPELKKEFYDVTDREIHMYKMEQFIQIAGKKEQNRPLSQIVEEISSLSNKSQYSEIDFIGLEYEPRTLARLENEIYELEEKNENRYNSIKGYERLISSGKAIPKQITQYHQTVASYNHDKKRIKELKRRLHQLTIINLDLDKL